ncbi:MAG: relaxase domain-containing protein [Acidobacteria bacterium]|nr:relaxase domain-containing protein [Acidobacteriota bacterium]
MTANDYYCENEHVAGAWIGKGAERLALFGKSIGKDNADFENLRRNLLPDGSGRLTPRRVESSVRFFDFQCAPHKSISIMAVALDDQRLYDAHDTAAAKAFAELERFSAYRSGRSRQPQITGNLCAAAFRHDASRSLDPQLHTHFVVANCTWDSESKRWLALETCEMFKAIRYAGKFYQNELALQCRRLGYEIQPVRNEKSVVEGFEIKGVSKEIQERFSKRRMEVEAGIERFLKDKGRQPTANEIHTIARDTRGIKLKEITTPEVRAMQRAQLSDEELLTLDGVKKAALTNAHENTGMGSAWKALMRACDHLFERHSVIPGHKLLAETLNQRLGYLDSSVLARYLQSASNGLVRLARHMRNPLLSCQWTSREGLSHERWSIQFVNQTQNCCAPLGKTEGVEFDFKSSEQKDVVLETLQTTDRVYAIRGCAGAGKTTCLTEVRKGLEAAGRKAFYLAPTASAVDVLRKDGFVHATTVDGFLINQEKNSNLNGSVIIIDESSLQSSKMGASLLRIAQAHDARVLFVGDIRQHVAIEAGDFLRILEQHSNLHRSELKDIRRQRDEEYNAAIRIIASGDALGGMKRLDALGWVQEGHGQYIKLAANSYFSATADGADLDRCIAISPTWEENHRFTEIIRNGLKQRNLLGKGTVISIHDQLDWTEEQKSNSANYRPGMLVTFNGSVGPIERGRTFTIDRIDSGGVWLKGLNRSIEVGRCSKKLTVSLSRAMEICAGDKILIRCNHRAAGLVNGQVFTVKQLNMDGSLETREGKFIPHDFRHFSHGYVVTSHKSQGRTHDHVVIAAEQLDSKSAYVACSRGRYDARVFTPDKSHLLKRLDRSADRLAATDVIGSSRAAFWQHNEQIARKRAANEAVFIHAAVDRSKSIDLQLN